MESSNSNGVSLCMRLWLWFKGGGWLDRTDLGLVDRY